MPIISDGNNQTGDELTDKHTTIGSTEHTGSYILSGSNEAILNVKDGLLFITSSDKIGIGTSSPGSKLDVSGDVNFDGAAVFNESGANKDFRIESDGMTHAFFVDAGSNMLGINTDSPKFLLDIKTNSYRDINNPKWEKKSKKIYRTPTDIQKKLNIKLLMLDYED